MVHTHISVGIDVSSVGKTLVRCAEHGVKSEFDHGSIENVKSKFTYYTFLASIYL